MSQSVKSTVIAFAAVSAAAVVVQLCVLVYFWDNPNIKASSRYFMVSFPLFQQFPKFFCQRCRFWRFWRYCALRPACTSFLLEVARSSHKGPALSARE